MPVFLFWGSGHFAMYIENAPVTCSLRSLLMKLKTRLAVAFMIITIVPMLLIFVSFFAINDHQARSFTKEYGLTEQVDLLNGNSTQVFNRLTRRVQQVIREELDKKPELYEDSSHLDEVNAELQKHYASFREI